MISPFVVIADNVHYVILSFSGRRPGLPVPSPHTPARRRLQWDNGAMNSTAHRADTSAATRTPPRWIIPAVLAVDIVLVIVFVAIGQREHTTQNGLLGLLTTASPFLIGLLVSSFAFCQARAERWLQVWPAGLGVWVGTLVIGMVLRVALGQGGAPAPFVAVAAGSLAVTLIGRRALSGRLRRLL